MIRREWWLRQNCSLAPRQLGLAFALLCLLSLAVSLLFILQGVWIILLFTALEITLVATAFLIYARHASDHEHIALLEDCLIIEKSCGKRRSQTRLDSVWTRIVPPARERDLIGIEAKGVKVDVGQFVSGHQRRQIARELKSALLAG